MLRDVFARPLFSPKLFKARFPAQPSPNGLNAAETALIERQVLR